MAKQTNKQTRKNFKNKSLNLVFLKKTNIFLMYVPGKMENIIEFHLERIQKKKKNEKCNHPPTQDQREFCFGLVWFVCLD